MVLISYFTFIYNVRAYTHHEQAKKTTYNQTELAQLLITWLYIEQDRTSSKTLFH